ncbi:hypothetical protein J1605_015600 [Eschrichtius robustus]|uniref:Uncharacterized protein n=1 Tax=Eschrichtius robustus TaxID=9764 RepID=A0AB34GAZ4_ESCRO|nr:hypothetical protein J1605_015600 [Eschrichtius robustus]
MEAVVFVFSLLDCCALIFLSVAGEREQGRRPVAGAGTLGAGPARRTDVASPGGRRNPAAQLRPSRGGPSGPLSRSAPAWPARRRSPL